MKIIKKYFNSNVLVIKPDIFRDTRGHFEESYNKLILKKNGIKKTFVQDNTSVSKNIYTFRGIHIQSAPFAQAKLIRVLKGSIIDYVVDLRLKSNTFGKFITIEINKNDNKQIYIPEGFGHAFLTTSKNTVVIYKVSKYYSKEHSISISYKDPKINLVINKKKFKFTLSKNDKSGIFKDEFIKKIKNNK